MFDFAVLAIGRADQADRITAVALNFEMKGERFASNGHQISTLNSNNQAKTTQCMATNEIQNGCESSIEAVLAPNHKRRCVYQRVGDCCRPKTQRHRPSPQWFGSSELKSRHQNLA